MHNIVGVNRKARYIFRYRQAISQRRQGKRKIIKNIIEKNEGYIYDIYHII